MTKLYIISDLNLAWYSICAPIDSIILHWFFLVLYTDITRLKLKYRMWAL